MGDFRITIDGVGSHGCQRDAQAGATLQACGIPGCVDCAAREFVASIQHRSASISSATLQHWPANGERRAGGPTNYPEDNLVTRTRTVAFLQATPIPAETVPAAPTVEVAADPPAVATGDGLAQDPPEGAEVPDSSEGAPAE